MPLHPIRSTSLSELAVEIFKNILAYTYYKETTPPTNAHLQYAAFIIHCGLEKSSLREEIYCQFIKQLIFPKDKVNINASIRVWELISMCAGCFAPSSYFLKYLNNFINETIDQWPIDSPISIIANYSKDRLIKVGELGKRLFVPTITELKKIRVRSPSFFYYIYYITHLIYYYLLL